MKKKLKFILLAFLMLFPTLKINAANGLIDIYTSSKKVTVGNTVTITTYCTSKTTIGTCEFTLTYDSSKLKFISAKDTVACNGTFCNFYVGSTKSSGKQFTFKVIATGTSSIGAKATGMIAFEDESSMSTSVSGTSITGVKASSSSSSSSGSSSSNTNKVYSTNNNLSSLSIEGYELDKKFSKDTLEYKVTLDSNVEEINVIAKQEDSKAKISGTGKIKVSEGENKIQVVVTSEKGTKKTYTIIATVTDKNPITINIDNNTYTLIKRTSLLTYPENYKEKKIVINDQEVTALYNEDTGYTLLGLKDNEGNIKLYIYNENDKSYTLYQELTFASLKLNVLKPSVVKENFVKTEITINEENVMAYKTSNDDKYYYIFAKNIETNEENWYVYEASENTIQKFNEEEYNKTNEKIEELKLVLFCFAASIGVLLIIIIIVSCNNVKLKKYKKLKKNNTEEKKKKNKDLFADL